MVAAGPVRFAVSVDPATVFLTISLACWYADPALGVPASPSRTTGRTHTFLSLLCRTSRSCGVPRKSCTVWTSWVSWRNLSTRVR